jgi:uncharacterized protein (TIGR03083 family)
MTDDARNEVQRADEWRAALRGSHDRMEALLTTLDPSALSEPSYCDDWTVSQVLSHLGSGAEIFSLILEANLEDRDPPGPESFPAIWDSWNSKSPEAQAADFVGADAALIEQIDAIDDDGIEAFHLAMFGMDLDAPTFFGMRESEHALHSWDVAVTLDPSARLAPDAVDLLVDAIAMRVERTTKPVEKPLRIHIETTAPKRSFLLSLGETSTMTKDPTPEEAADAARLEITGEALIRLFAGRLDPDHTPEGISTVGVTLDQLRELFPGF